MYLGLQGINHHLLPTYIKYVLEIKKQSFRLPVLKLGVSLWQKMHRYNFVVCFLTLYSSFTILFSLGRNPKSVYFNSYFPASKNIKSALKHVWFLFCTTNICKLILILQREQPHILIVPFSIFASATSSPSIPTNFVKTDLILKSAILQNVPRMSRRKSELGFRLEFLKDQVFKSKTFLIIHLILVLYIYASK